MTGGAGCNTMEAGKRCPGMREVEYRTEFSLWVIGASSMIVSTDLRNMSTFMKETLMDAQMLTIHQDEMGIAGGLVDSDTSSPGCSSDSEDGSSYCQMWARPLTGGRWAMALYNRNNVSATVTGEFSKLPPQPQTSILGDNPHYAAGGKGSAPPAALIVFDVWENLMMGSYTGKLAAKLGPHETKVLLLSQSSAVPMAVPPPWNAATAGAGAGCSPQKTCDFVKKLNVAKAGEKLSLICTAADKCTIDGMQLSGSDGLLAAVDMANVLIHNNKAVTGGLLAIGGGGSVNGTKLTFRNGQANG